MKRWCFIVNRTVTPPAFGEQLIKRAQNLCLPAVCHKNQRVVSSTGVSSWHVAIPLQWTARADTNAIISAKTTAVARAVTSLWFSGRMLCLQPADICKLLLQRRAWFQALCITAYGFFSFLFLTKKAPTLYAPISFFCVFANTVPLLNASTAVVLLPYIWWTKPHSHRGLTSL